MNFTDYFEVDPNVLETYGAFDVSLVSDLPLFIDPFLLFNSEKAEYQVLHASIIRYLTFLRDKSLAGQISPGLLKSWYHFKEVKQNWFGFTTLGNGGHGLGSTFADSLDKNLGRVFRVGSSPSVTRGDHLEEVSLIRGGVGRDSISDFTTNLIKEHLLTYTQKFAAENIDALKTKRRTVPRVSFNYSTESWESRAFLLPIYENDFVILTPIDLLTRDENWINRIDMIRGFDTIPPAIANVELRALVSNYFQSQLKIPNPTKKDRDFAANATIDRFPELVDYYIALKELSGEKATHISIGRVNDVQRVFVEQIKNLVKDIAAKTEIYRHPQSSYEEALFRARAFKQYVENQDGYKLINRSGGPFSRENEVQLFFGLAFVGTRFDVNREPNNGGGPVDFKISSGAYDKSLVEFKLASNSQLKRNLQNQIEVYKKANQTKKSVTVIVYYTAQDQQRVQLILKELGISGREDIVLIDARSDNKPTGSKA